MPTYVSVCGPPVRPCFLPFSHKYHRRTRVFFDISVMSSFSSSSYSASGSLASNLECTSNNGHLVKWKVSRQFRGLCLMREDFTMPRNPIVTRIFRVIKLAENAGSDFDKMINGWKAYYEDVPVVSGGVDYYKITFPLVKTGEKVTYKLVDGLVETQILMLQLMKENPHISKREMAESVGISTTAIDKNIVSLKKKGLLKRIGSPKGGYWEVVGK